MTDIKLKSTHITNGTSRIDLAKETASFGYFATVWVDADGEKGRRIVACWNACAGIDTATLELAAAGDHAANERVTDELVSKMLAP